MKKKDMALILVVLVLAGVYAVYFTDWFRTKTIHISHTVRPGIFATRHGNGSKPSVQLGFALDGYYDLTEIKVVPLAELKTNSLAQPVWHLVSDEGSDDMNHFFYGENIQSMDSAVEGARAEPLQPGVTYRIFIAAGKIKGQHDFEIK